MNISLENIVALEFFPSVNNNEINPDYEPNPYYSLSSEDKKDQITNAKLMIKEALEDMIGKENDYIVSVGCWDDGIIWYPMTIAKFKNLMETFSS